MSSSLVWEPAERKQKSLPTALKWVLQKRNGGTIDHMEMGQDDLHYIMALKDAGVDGAEELYDAVVKHGTIHLFEQF